MKLTEVTFSDLSNIVHQIFISEHQRFATPDFKIIKFVGVYDYGSAGANDGLYIRAIYEAVHTAWYTHANILDFTELDYQWGDQMDHVFNFGWNSYIQYQHPLVVIVGERCREALQSLLTSNYQKDCCDTLEEAIQLAKQKHLDHEKHLAEWRNSVGI